ncbi:putative DNA polymerase delta, subunit 4 [Arabidopsis thaliana]|jgi:DNA polymerase delta subunit 4|uniref:At1g09815 n=4 Tax=Arabidopsis TaxID=3701 RepID=Q1H568_ARATH|nr:polymerase delta 4 [Arabidopsis thaliana]KAG7596465.1 DNA polymerase delta subunit 4 [Arabidopsis suecica]KAG7645727.1 DNA polymerase delta subunit 4 [Arabidopsis thaliana x Arabidopsis arenosa]ABF59014.1 At1g09815 [Arabidopsis thaliana]AEE28498.1 polymerase delta 4 [Arabidopsis thaliana]OAP17095.1 POLD4 [Arabidopsis thaliana]|eukprot:NP_563854.1 polymerase delta 4 [Arabidopsis thaliana]
MATTAKNLKGFYKQTKSNITGGISKSKPSSRKVAPKHAAAQGSDVTQPAALISHGSVDLNEDYDKEEEMLRQFDMNITYGPCLGMTRLDRWERAVRLGMNPPNEIEKLLKTGKVQQDCLWQGRV